MGKVTVLFQEFGKYLFPLFLRNGHWMLSTFSLDEDRYFAAMVKLRNGIYLVSGGERHSSVGRQGTTILGTSELLNRVRINYL